MKKVIIIIKKYQMNELGSKSAEVAFYLLLSLFPFLLFTINVITYIPIIQINRYIYSLENIMPQGAYLITSSLINSAIKSRSLDVAITSFVLTIWTSSRAVRALIRSMNRFYRVKESRSFFKVCKIALCFTLILILLIFSSVIFLIFGEKIGVFLIKLINLDKGIIGMWNLWRYLIGASTMIVIFLSLFIYTPNETITIKDAIPGAIISTISWNVISYMYSYYANNFTNYEVVYGSIGGVIVLITWIYLISWSILIGSKVNSIIFLNKKYKSKVIYLNKKYKSKVKN